MSNETTPPPVQGPYASYPRASDTHVYGSSEKLSKLFRGYHGLSYAFLCVFVTLILIVVTLLALDPKVDNTLLGVFAGILTITGLAGSLILGIRAVINIGQGCDWPAWLGPFLGLLVPIMGIIPIVILQMFATSEMKNYGIKLRPFRGLSKKEVNAKIEELQAIERGQPGFGTP